MIIFHLLFLYSIYFDIFASLKINKIEVYIALLTIDKKKKEVHFISRNRIIA